MDVNYVLKLLGFQIFQHIFIWIMTIIWFFLKTLIHINVLPIWKYKKSNYNSTSIILSYTCISKTVFKHILKHAIIQYYAMKSKNFLYWSLKLKLFMNSM
jgi:hypothetical protein